MQSLVDYEALADLYVRTQKLRIASQLQVQRYAEQGRKGSLLDFILEKQKALAELEAELLAESKKHTESLPCHAWLSKVKGIGPSLTLKLVGRLSAVDKETGEVQGLERFVTVSKLWKWCGLDVTRVEVSQDKHETQARDASQRCHETHDTSAPIPLRQSGKKLTYDCYTKSVVFLCARQFLLLGEESPFYRYYLSCKAKDKQKHPDKIHVAGKKYQFGDLHLHHRAMRKTGKLFLSFLWDAWREGMGLPATPPYALAHLEGHTRLDKWDFV